MLPHTYVSYMWHYSVSFKIWLFYSCDFLKWIFFHLENNRIIRCLLISSSDRREIIHIFLTQNGPRLALICGSQMYLSSVVCSGYTRDFSYLGTIFPYFMIYNCSCHLILYVLLTVFSINNFYVSFRRKHTIREK